MGGNGATAVRQRNVRQNVTDGLRKGNRPDLGLLVDLLELSTLMDRRVGSLSGGSRALFQSGRAAARRAALAAVDLPRRRRIVDALLGIRDELSVPLIYVTHLPEEALTVADWTVLIDNGRIAASGPPRDVMPAD
jgi:molybdate transport system ATP-binding protein